MRWAEGSESGTLILSTRLYVVFYLLTFHLGNITIWAGKRERGVRGDDANRRVWWYIKIKFLTIKPSVVVTIVFSKKRKKKKRKKRKRKKPSPKTKT